MSMPFMVPIALRRGDSVAERAELDSARATSTLTASHAHRRRRSRHPVERAVLLLLSFAAFLACGWHLAHAGVIPGDSLSRTLSAADAVTGRDPHPEAIGFVWPPFPTLFEILPVAVLRLRDMVSIGLAGVVVSAGLMAGAVGAVRTWLEECGVGRFARIGLTIAFAASPMILLYGSNGMSEAGMLCFLVLAAIRIARWLDRDSTQDIVVASLWLGMAYLTRYEVAASIVAVVGLVALVTYRRESGSRRVRRRVAVTAAAVVGLPAVFAALLWALLSWAVIGQPFAQFTSEYGNSAIVRSTLAHSGAGPAADPGGRLLLLGEQVAVFGGLAIVSIVLLLWFTRRGWSRVLAALSVMVPPVLFQAIAAATGTTFGFARFTISMIPLGTMLLGVVIADVRTTNRLVVGSAALLACALALGASLPSLDVLRRGSLGTRDDDTPAMTAMPGPYRSTMRHQRVTPLDAGREVAAAIERLSPRPGSVLVDTSWAFPIVISASDRRIYVTPPDRDFMQVLSDPQTFHVKYVLVSSPSTVSYDSVRATFNGFYETGSGIAKLVEEWHYPSMRLRLYRVDKAVAR
jgi:hypothetical protein